MNYSDVQAYFAARLSESPELAPYLPVLVYSEDASALETQTAIDTALSTKGVCLEVSELTGGDTNTVSGRTLLQAGVTLYIAESRTVAHALRGAKLVERVVAAACAQSSTSCPVKCTTLPSFTSERGYKLHIIDVSVPAQIA